MHNYTHTHTTVYTSLKIAYRKRRRTNEQQHRKKDTDTEYGESFRKYVKYGNGSFNVASTFVAVWQHFPYISFILIAQII